MTGGVGPRHGNLMVFCFGPSILFISTYVLRQGESDRVEPGFLLEGDLG